MTKPDRPARCALRRALAHTLTAAAGLLGASAAHTQVGLQQLTLDQGRISAALWYATTATSKTQRFGPFEVDAAVCAAPIPGRHALVLISHGTGAHERAHAWLAQRLAARGYMVLSVRHPATTGKTVAAWAARATLRSGHGSCRARWTRCSATRAGRHRSTPHALPPSATPWAGTAFLCPSHHRVARQRIGRPR